MTRRTPLRSAVALLAALGGLAAVPAEAQDRALQFATELPAGPVGTRTMVIDRRAGTGPEAEPERFIVIDYEGFVYDPAAPDRKGMKFDSSRDRGQPLSVLFGVGRMITGLDKGLLGMKVGGTRVLVIPSNMGYGARQAFGEVPPNSTLLFEVELLDVVPQENVR
jgi:FKBP-type peptidyl-prolyl cis-trans isomerase FkpA